MEIFLLYIILGALVMSVMSSFWAGGGLSEGLLGWVFLSAIIFIIAFIDGVYLPNQIIAWTVFIVSALFLATFIIAAVVVMIQDAKGDYDKPFEEIKYSEPEMQGTRGDTSVLDICQVFDSSFNPKVAKMSKEEYKAYRKDF